MSTLASLLVNRPFNILAIAAVFAIAWIAVRSTSWGAGRRPGALLLPAAAWGLYALWEWAVTRWSPEADIRVDLLVIWPAVLVISLGGLIWVLRDAR